MRTIRSELAGLKEEALFRKIHAIESSQETAIELVGHRLINFSSNDYLGLASDPIVREAMKAAVDEFGAGSGASRLVCGTLAPHVQLERKLAEFKRTEAALTFATGYMTALGTLSALLTKDDVVILDKLAHACLIDGARLSRATVRVFPHNHMGKLESHLQWARAEYPDARVVVATESVFSMDGDRAELEQIVALKKKYRALLLLDEAHAVGVIGEHGRGLADKLGLAADVDIQMGTLSKALGVSGGYVCGRRPLIELLVNKARSFIYSTAPPPAVAAAASAALDFLESADGEKRRRKLWQNIKRLADQLPGKSTRIESAIVPWIVGDEALAMQVASELREEGFFVPGIRYPTVPKGSARLRITVSAKHEAAHIDALCAALKRLQAGTSP